MSKKKKAVPAPAPSRTVWWPYLVAALAVAGVALLMHEKKPTHRPAPARQSAAVRVKPAPALPPIPGFEGEAYRATRMSDADQARLLRELKEFSGVGFQVKDPIPMADEFLAVKEAMTLLVEISNHQNIARLGEGDSGADNICKWFAGVVVNRQRGVLPKMRVVPTLGEWQRPDFGVNAATRIGRVPGQPMTHDISFMQHAVYAGKDMLVLALLHELAHVQMDDFALASVEGDTDRFVSMMLSQTGQLLISTMEDKAWKATLALFEFMLEERLFDLSPGQPLVRLQQMWTLYTAREARLRGDAAWREFVANHTHSPIPPEGFRGGPAR